MAEDKNQTHYFLDESPDELKRLDLGQQVISSYMGKPVWAPIDFSKPGYKILDSACANGMPLDVKKVSLTPQYSNMAGGPPCLASRPNRC